MTESTRRYETRHYPTSAPAVAAERAAFNVGLILGTWQLTEPVIETLVTQTHALVLEAAEESSGERVVVITALEYDRAAVHVLPVSCTADHPDQLIDPATTAVLTKSAEYWGATGQQPCLCMTLAMLGDDWKSQRPFITPPSA